MAGQRAARLESLVPQAGATDESAAAAAAGGNGKDPAREMWAGDPPACTASDPAGTRAPAEEGDVPGVTDHEAVPLCVVGFIILDI